MLENIKKPNSKTLIVRDEVQERTTSSGIILVGGKSKREKTDRAIVVKVADDLLDKYSEGDIVVYPKYRRTNEDGDIFVLKHDDIMGKFIEEA
jgi:co-chaperonin GroES (HSP10)